MRLSYRRLLAAPLLLALFVPVVLASPAGAPSRIVSWQGEGGGAYLVPAVLVDVAGELTLVNADLRAHDVVAIEYGPSDNPWCGRYRAGECPLFASRLVGVAGQSVVEGIGQLAPLSSYEFTCSIHGWMTGTITAI